MSIVPNSRIFGKVRGLIPFLFAFWFAFTTAVPASALPLAERLPASLGAPLDLLTDEPDGVFVPTFGEFKDEYIFTFDGAILTIIDTDTWALHSTQPDTFSDTIADVALLGDGVTLVVALSTGNLARIDLSDEDSFANTDTEDTTSDSSDNDTDNDVSDDDEDTGDSREANSSSNMTSPGISAIAVDPGSTAETVYMINGTAKFFYFFNFATNRLTEVSLTDPDAADTTTTTSDDTTATTTAFTPVGIAYADIGNDQVLVTTSTGDLLAFSAGDTSFSVVTLAARDSTEATPAFGAIALSTDGFHAFIIDTANDFIWVYSVSGGTFVDQIDGGTAIDPIEFTSTDENAELTDIAIFQDPTDDEDFGYIAGSLGVSVIDASSPDTKADNKRVDVVESTTDVDEPIDLTGSPAFIAASSGDDGYVYAVNTDGSIAVITDNPFVTISASTAATVTLTAPTFALTFQSDAAGTYLVKANSNPSGESGTLLTPTAALVDTANADIVTDTFTIVGDDDHSIFREGNNKIFVFVTDAAGFTGRDAFVLNVDRPPGEIDINAVNFGSRKVYVVFTESTDEDIDFYRLYAEPAESQASPTCPGSLTFTSAAASNERVSASACTTSPCEGTVTNLTNDVSYCVAIQATDLAGQEGPITAYTTAVTTQATVGPAGFLGEAGCALTGTRETAEPTPLRTSLWSAFLVISSLLWWGLRKRGDKKYFFLFVLLLSGFFFRVTPAHAEVPLDPEHFTFELRGGLWIPTRPQVQQFFPACCNPLGEIEFGYIHENRYNVILATGFTYLTGSAIGVTNGLPSGDRFSLAMIPVRLDFAYRFDFKPDQLLVPYLRSGFDAVLFREKSSGSDTSVQGCKFGLHGAGGLAILLDNVDSTSNMDSGESGINDVYLTFEGRFAYVNSFSSTGLDLTGFYPYAGILFQF